jgi:D-alanyl-D-alanine carboxypeptidase (penicillin-binding protein 5/6)
MSVAERTVVRTRLPRVVCRLGLCTAVVLLVQSTAIAADTELAARITPLIAQHQGKVAVAIKHLSKGNEFEHNGDAVMPTASLIKFPVMVAAYRLVDEGKVKLDDSLTLRDEDKVPGSGILTNHFTGGMHLTLRDAIRLMIAFSDNTATNLVLERIGLKTTADTMEQLGFPHTKIHAKVFRGDTSIFPERSKQYGLGSTTPKDMIRLLEMLHEKKLASASSCEAMLQHLHACEDKDKLIRDLPAGTKLAHKTGSVNAVRTDAGIIFTPNGPIAICVMTAENEDKRWTRENAAEILCGKIGRSVYDYFNPPRANKAAETREKIAVGSMGPLVESLQRTLNAVLSPSPELSVDGDFGGVTREAVVRFQKEKGLPPTGDVGPETWKALGPLRTEVAVVPEPAVVNNEPLTLEPVENLAAAPLVTCKAWAIADGETGVLLWGQSERQKLHFASTTKVMTAYIVLKLAEKEPSIMDEVVTFSQRADDTVGSSAEVRAGEKLPVRELLYGLMLPSGNDASVAFAEHFGDRFKTNGVSDPYENFVAEMNRTAQELGMRDTHYSNPHGLTASKHQSTAADLVILARAARQLASFRHYTTTRQHGYTVGSTAGYTRNIVWKNTNKLLAITGYDGVKTGTTDAAGACLISAGQHAGDELIVVVLGASNSEARYIDSRNLFRWAWQTRKAK